jgi:transposase
VNGWSANALVSSIKSAPSCWSAASQCGKGKQHFLRTELPRILATPPDVLSPRMVRLIEGLTEDWRRVDQRIEDLSSEIEELANSDPACVRLMSVPGIGPIISSAMVAAIGTGDGFSQGRDFAAWLGLVPKHISTGVAPFSAAYRSVAIAICASYSCRQPLVKVSPNRRQGHGLKPWIEAAKKRLHHNVLAIALANKLARIAWSVARGRGFEVNKLQAA